MCYTLFRHHLEDLGSAKRKYVPKGKRIESVHRNESSYDEHKVHAASSAENRNTWLSNQNTARDVGLTARGLTARVFAL